MSALFRVFPNDPVPEAVLRTDGLYVETPSGRFLDMTAGSTSYAILGGGHPEVIAAMQAQLGRFTHVDYKAWSDPNTERLAQLLLSRAEHGLDRVYFAGNSGGEACEAAMKMSYQVHHDAGHPERTWFISREQSYHGSSADALALGDRPNLDFYRPLLPAQRAKVPQHHYLREALPGETPEQYAVRSADQLEHKILELGAQRVAAFVAETMMGGLVGDVPPSPGYWRRVREICDRHGVHLILDEVYCGTGTSGKVYCCDWDGVTPDFLFLGKTVAAGYAPLSLVLTGAEMEAVIARGQRRLQHSTTHQAYSLGVAAAVAVQTVIHRDGFLEGVNALGEHMRVVLREQLGDHPFFRDLRGRGLRFSLEYQCPEQHCFGLALVGRLRERHGILISGKWHRVSFTPALVITREQAETVLEHFVEEFRALAREWPKAGQSK
jgi:adenosylmethionine-8-amino-7-oxononanoate aminotransferase